jgi:hypothetical protein
MRLADVMPIHARVAAILAALGAALLPVAGMASMAGALVVAPRAAAVSAAVAVAMRDLRTALGARVAAASAVAAMVLCGLGVAPAMAAVAAAAALRQSGHCRRHRGRACEEDELTHDITPEYDPGSNRRHGRKGPHFSAGRAQLKPVMTVP